MTAVWFFQKDIKGDFSRHQARGSIVSQLALIACLNKRVIFSKSSSKMFKTSIVVVLAIFVVAQTNAMNNTDIIVGLFMV